MFNVEDYITLEERENADRPWFTIHTDDAFPALIKHIQTVIKANKPSVELIDIRPHPEIAPVQAARMHLANAQAVAPDAWDDALKPRSHKDFPSDDEVRVALALHAGGDPLPENVQRLMRRAQAVHVVRKWFTRALKNAKGAVGVHWLDSEYLKDGMP